MTNPIYIDGEHIKSYGSINNEKVRDKLQKACAPYVEDLAQKMQKQAQI